MVKHLTGNYYWRKGMDSAVVCAMSAADVEYNFSLGNEADCDGDLIGYARTEVAAFDMVADLG